MLSVEQINKMEQDIEAYKQSEEEAKEIIAELKHKNKLLKDTIKNKKLVGIVEENERLKEENKLIRQMHKDLSDKLFEFQKIEGTLQEIKAIAEDAYENESEY